MSHPVPPAAVDVGLVPDLARVAIDELRAVRDKLVQVRNDAVRVGQIPDTAFDAISRQSFALLRSKADGGPGSLTWALTGGVEYLEKMITQLEHDLAESLGADDEAAQGISRP